MEGNSLAYPRLSWESESEGQASRVAGRDGRLLDLPLGI
jgi:hypothetical protein